MMYKELLHSIRGHVNVLRHMTLLLWQVHPGLSVTILILQFLQGLFPLAQAWILKTLFDFLALGFQTQVLPWQELTFILALQIALNVIGGLLQSLNGYISSEMVRQITLNVQLSLYGKLSNLAGLKPFEDPHTQNIIQMGMLGGQMGPEQVFSILLQLVGGLTTLFGFMGVIIGLNPLLALLVVLAAIPSLFYQLKMGRLHFDLASEQTPIQRRVSYYGGVLTAPFYAKEIILFGLGKYFLNAFQYLTQQLYQGQRLQQLRELRWNLGLGFFAALISGGAFGFVVLQVFARNLTLGDISLYTNAVSSVQGAFSSIIFGVASLNEATLFFSRYTELMALPQSITVPQNPRPAFRPKSTIEFRGVSFRYGEEQPWILKDLNLTLSVGKSIALVGLNGAGKTTIVKLLTRLYDPVDGQILWDGVDIREFDPDEFRQRIGVIFQDFVHFDMTAFENIALGNVEILGGHKSNENYSKVQDAAIQAGIHETLEALPQGYQTILSRWLADDDQGKDLSGGEWQKVAIARMLVRDADFLILDEPTSALDAQAEYDLYNRFVELIKGRTSLLISHRFSSVRMADDIVVLKNGRVIEFGSHAELVGLKGEYARLYEMQAERYR